MEYPSARAVSEFCTACLAATRLEVYEERARQPQPAGETPALIAAIVEKHYARLTSYTTSTVRGALNDAVAEALSTSEQEKATLREALRNAVEDAEARWDMDDPRTNPGIKQWVANAKAALSSTGPNTACRWTLDDEDGLVYATTCGHLFQFNDGGPKENDAAYCQYCGGRLVVSSTGPNTETR